MKAPLIPASMPQAVLTITAGQGEGSSIACRRVVTLVGSRAGCKVNLQHPSVAPVHLALVQTGTQIMARDLGSVRGTRLNDLPMELEALADDDVLSIGPWELRVRLMAPSVPTFEPSLEPDHGPGAVTLEHLASRRLFQPTREVCVVGRRSRCDIAIDDPCVSRVHALIFKHLDRPVVTDLLASTPLCVNGVDQSFAALADGHVLRIGNTEFRVRMPMMRSKPSPATNGRHEPPWPRLPLPDLIDIRASESSRWAVADHLENIERPGEG